MFANRAPKELHNLLWLKKTSDTSGNPVALFRTTYRGGPRRLHKAVKRHFLFSADSGRDQTKALDRTRLCVGCKVSICGRNLKPEWGLCNSAVGTVKEIHFSCKDDGSHPNPNNNDMCDYVVVHFPGYKGPVWDKHNPACVPVPAVNERCRYGCCVREFLPLEVCFATTIHKVEGLSIGKSKNNSEPNSAECMIVDIGSRQFEMNCPGLFYTACSRATTDGGGDPNLSSVLFMKSNVVMDRLLNMTYTEN